MIMRGDVHARCLRWGYFIALLYALIAVPVAYPQPALEPEDPVFERYSVEEGLPSFTVTGALQDRQGFLWFATLSGLSRYDGYSFTTFEHDPGDPGSLSDDHIYFGALHEDRDGFLWIGTQKGLNRYDPATGRFTRYTHDPQDPTSLSNDHVHAILETRQGTLWVGTENGLNRMAAPGRFVRYNHRPGDARSLPSNYVTALYQDSDDVLWVGTSSGMSRYDLKDDAFTPYLCDSEDLAGSCNYVTTFYESADGRFWIGTWGAGLVRFVPGAATFTSPPGWLDETGGSDRTKVLAITEDHQGHLWVGTWGAGLARLNLKSGDLTFYTRRLENPRSLSSDLISSLLVDRSGILWAGTWNGISKRSASKPFRSYTYRPDHPARSLSHPKVQEVYVDSADTAWIGTRRGLSALDLQTGRIRHLRSNEKSPSPRLSSNLVWSIAEDATGALWVATEGGGLNRLDRAGGTFTHFLSRPGDASSISSNLLYTVHASSNGDLWIGTVDAGLDHFDLSTGEVTHYRRDPGDPTSLSYDAVFSLYEDAAGTLWVGTIGGGLNRFDAENGTFQRYRSDPDDPQSLSGDRVLTIQEGPAGNLWIGTMGSGLNRLDRETGRFQRYTTRDGLVHDNVVCILPGEEKDLWIGTLGGLSHLDLRTETFSNYSVAEGLPSAVFQTGACDKSSRGELLFGTAEGLVLFDPDQILTETQPPPVVLTEVELFDEPASLDSTATHLHQVVLPHDQNFVAFHFAALDYTAPSQNEYAYRLEGLDKDWIYAGARRYAGYPNLPPGAYTFHVKGTNSDGVWSEHTTSMRLFITPPYWQTWWFRLLLAGLAAALVFTAHRYRVHHLLQVERTRERIAQDLHDDVGNEISSLAFLLELEGRSDDLDVARRERLLDLSRSAHRVTDAIRETKWIADTRNDTLTGLIDRMHEETYTAAPLDGHVRFEAPADLPPVQVGMEMRKHIYLIFKEALYNARRHAQAKRVVVRIGYADKTLCMRVKDDGIGFDPDDDSRGSGLGNMQIRSRHIGGELTIKSRPGEGSTVSLQVRMA